MFTKNLFLPTTEKQKGRLELLKSSRLLEKETKQESGSAGKQQAALSLVKRSAANQRNKWLTHWNMKTA